MTDTTLALQRRRLGLSVVVTRYFRGRIGWALLIWPALLYLLLVYVLPTLVMLRESVISPQPGLQNFTRAVLSPAYSAIGLRTLWIALVATALTLLIGYPLAYFMASTGPFVQRLLIIAVISPYLTSSLVRTFAWEVLLGKFGPVTQVVQALHVRPAELLFTQAGVMIGLVHILLPSMILILFSVMRGIDGRLVKAARSLGAGPATGFLRVFLPLSLPGIEAGSILTFVFGVGSFVTPAILGGQKGTMYGVIIQTAVDQFADFGFASAAALVLAATVALVLIAYRRLMAGNVVWLASPELLASHTAASAPRVAWKAAVGRPLRYALDGVGQALDWSRLTSRRLPLAVFAAAASLFILLPQLIALPISLTSTPTLVFPPVGLSLRWYENFFTQHWLGPAGTSVVVAAVAAVAATCLGGLAAMGVARGLGPRLTGPVTVFFLLPLLVPSIVSVVGIYVVFLHAHLTDTLQGFMLANTALSIPGAFVVLGASIRSLDPAFERAGASLGARWWQVILRIVVPMIRPAVLVSLFFTFLAAFDEVIIAIFLSGVRVTTLPRRMYEAIQYESDPTIGVVAMISIVVAVAVLFGSGRFLGRGSAARL